MLTCKPNSNISHQHSYYGTTENVNPNSHHYSMPINWHTLPVQNVPCSLEPNAPTPAHNDWGMKKKDMNMASFASAAVVAGPSDEAKKIDYLSRRVNSIYETHRYTGLTKWFNLNASGRPETADGLIAAIKGGKFEIDQKKVDKEAVHLEKYGYSRYSAIDFLKFTDVPTADGKGADKAKEALKTERQKVLDIVNIMPADEALKAVQDFEAWTPEGIAS